MPSVMTLTSVDADDSSVNRTWYPTRSPSATPGPLISSLMRSATVRAAMRRGCVWPICPSRPRPSSSMIFGSCVVFPEPVSPATMTTWWSRIAAEISARRAETGSCSG
jgi:hypothetical protein